MAGVGVGVGGGTDDVDELVGAEKREKTKGVSGTANAWAWAV